MKATVQTKITSSSDERARLRALQELIARWQHLAATEKVVETLGDSSVQTIWGDADPLPYSSAVEFAARVVAISSAGTAYAAAEVVGLFRRPSSGAAAQVGATQTRHSLVSAGVAVTIGVDADSKLWVKLDDGGAVLSGRVFVEGRPI